MHSNKDSMRWSCDVLLARSILSEVAEGPAASSAKVMLEIANSSGNTSGSISPRSRTTDVSSNPRSYAYLNPLVEVRVYVDPELLRIDFRRSPESIKDILLAGKTGAAQWSKFSDGLSVTCHNETPPRIQLTHDSGTFVAQLPLANDVRHALSVAPIATGALGSRRPRRGP